VATSLREIADLVDGQLLGDGSIEILRVSGLEEAQPGDLSFLANPRYRRLLKTTRATAVLVPQDVSSAPLPLIQVKNPHLALALVLEHLHPAERPQPGIHPTALIGQGTVIGAGISVGPYTVIEDRVQVGDRAVIGALCAIGPRARIGSETRIYSRVTVREDVQVGERVTIHSGAVIGADGFGYAKTEKGHHKIPQVGTVIVEDDVEIGANVTIDRATLGATRIGRGTKIDNLVQIAHNVQIGRHCILCAQVGISGSTVIGDNVTLAGQAGVGGHLQVGDGATAGGQAGVTRDVPPGTVVSGYPARPHEQAKKREAAALLMPNIIKQLRSLEREVAALRDKSLKKNS
jgi:UDP-3-O-[3-hydroxymyristoyl] glucosamine N-acyltransferase